MLGLSLLWASPVRAAQSGDPIHVDQQPPLYAWVTLGRGHDLMASVGNDGIATVDWDRVRRLAHDPSGHWQMRALADLLLSVHDGTARTAQFGSATSPAGQMATQASSAAR